jgi:hypothetical protein
MMRNGLRQLGVRGLVIATLLVTGARSEEDVQEPNDEEEMGASICGGYKANRLVGPGQRVRGVSAIGKAETFDP